ncbi:MAG: transposase [Thermoplasmata archaeon]
MTTRKSWSSDEKFHIVLESLQPGVNVAEICRRHGVHSAQIYEWRQRALASMKAGLKGGGNPESVLRQENGRLKKVVADLTIANDVLKEYLEGNSMGKKGGGSS